MLRYILVVLVYAVTHCNAVDPAAGTDTAINILPGKFLSNGMNGLTPAQQIIYIYGPHQWKMQNVVSLMEKGGSDYLVTPGMSAHKLHIRKLPWNRARKVCLQEGGHLAIINSNSEEKILSRILEDNKIPQAWLGVHDLYEEGDWITIMDEPLEASGFSKWKIPQPDNYGGKQHCGILMKDGGMDDLECTSVQAFFCEINLTEHPIAAGDPIDFPVEAHALFRSRLRPGGCGCNHGSQCTRRHGQGRTEEADREHEVPGVHGTVASVEEHRGDAGVRGREREERPADTRARQEEQSLGRERQVHNHVIGAGARRQTVAEEEEEEEEGGGEGSSACIQSEEEKRRSRSFIRGGRNPEGRDQENGGAAGGRGRGRRWTLGCSAIAVLGSARSRHNGRRRSSAVVAEMENAACDR